MIFCSSPRPAWKDLPRDAFAYGKAFASAFGPSAKGGGLVDALEVGNEPGKYDDATYRLLFENMARGAKEGDPQIRVATCAGNLGKSGTYYRSLDLFTGLEPLYDVVNIHIYAEAESWPTWRRSYPEDPGIDFLKNVHHLLIWRRQHVPEKEVWLTEFGWDASTKPAPPTGTFSKWQGSTETQQAQWIVRAWMLLAAAGLDRAYLFFFNDDDSAQIHGSSGLTRNFQPKPAFHAAAHLQRTLGEYRFARAIREDLNDCYAYEFTHGSDVAKRIWAVWKATGSPGRLSLPAKGAKVLKAERTPLVPGDVAVPASISADGALELEAGELPTFIWLAP